MDGEKAQTKEKRIACAYCGNYNHDTQKHNFTLLEYAIFEVFLLASILFVFLSVTLS